MQLCQIPGCRQRGKHWPSCDDDACTGCLPRLAVEGLACDWHVERAERHLAEIQRLAPDARLVAQGLVRRGTGGGSGKPASRPPGNLEALDTLDGKDGIHDVLTRRCIRIAITRGMRFHVPCLPSCIHPTPSQAHCSVCHITFGGITGFDRHRRDGQCLTPEAIDYARDDRGVYRAPMSEAGKARLEALRASVAAQNGSVVPVPTLEIETGV